LAKRARIVGKVILAVTVNEEGFVSEVRVTSGHPLLNEAAVKAVRQWRYSPTLLNGEPVPVMTTVTCVFNLRGNDYIMPSVDRSGATVEITAAAAEPQANAGIVRSGRAAIKVGGNVQESKLIQRVEPVYPELAKRARIVGKVTLVVTVNEEGFVSDVRVTSGHPLLNEAAVEAVRQWRYSPTLLNGEPVPVMTTVTCVFNFMGKDDVMLSLDESGDLKGYGSSTPGEDLIQNMPLGGTARINIAPGMPIREAERIVQDLLRREIKLEVAGAYTLYEGKLFYTMKPTSGPQFAFDLAKLNRLFEASQANDDPGRPRILRYSIYVNEVGEIVGVQRQAGPDNPEIDRELMNTPAIAPAFLGPDPIPYMYVFDLTR
jgi:TonB family protein